METNVKDVLKREPFQRKINFVRHVLTPKVFVKCVELRFWIQSFIGNPTYENTLVNDINCNPLSL